MPDVADGTIATTATAGKIIQVVPKTDSSDYSTTSQSYQQGPQTRYF